MPRTITRADLAETVVRKAGVSRSEAPAIVDLIFEEISRALERDEDVKLSSFATFSILKKNSRIGRNPKTGEEAEITPRTVLSFIASKVLKDKVLAAHLRRQK